MAKILTYDEVLSLISMEDAVQSCERTFAGFGAGTVINPTKVTLDVGEVAPYPPYEGFFNAMPAYLGYDDYDVAGIKWVLGILGHRRKAGLPFISGMILLADPRLGIFKAVMDGKYITNLRTGAQTAVTLKYVFKGQKSISVGLYGCGQQGRTQIEAISKVFEIEELRLYDIFPAAMDKFKADMSWCVKGEIIPCATPAEAADADALITVTQAKEPFLTAEMVKPGTMVFPMGSYKEVTDELILAADTIVVDHVGQALHRGGLKTLADQGKLTEANLTTTVGALVNGDYDLGDVSQKRMVCALIGTGAMDIGCAEMVYRRAVERGIGQEFDFNGELLSTCLTAKVFDPKACRE